MFSFTFESDIMDIFVEVCVYKGGNCVLCVGVAQTTGTGTSR